MRSGREWCGSGWVVAGVWVLATVLLAGCQSVPMGHVGGRVPAQKRMALAQDGSHSATYRTEDLVIDYRYSRNQSLLELSGSIRFADSIRYSFRRVDGFHADVIFMNESGVVVASQALTTGSSDSSDSPIMFKTSVTVSQDVVAISFAYTGNAVATGGGSGARMGFWDNPAR